MVLTGASVTSVTLRLSFILLWGFQVTYVPNERTCRTQTGLKMQCFVSLAALGPAGGGEGSMFSESQHPEPEARSACRAISCCFFQMINGRNYKPTPNAASIPAYLCASPLFSTYLQSELFPGQHSGPGG